MERYAGEGRGDIRRQASLSLWVGVIVGLGAAIVREALAKPNLLDMAKSALGLLPSRLKKLLKSDVSRVPSPSKRAPNPDPNGVKVWVPLSKAKAVYKSRSKKGVEATAAYQVWLEYIHNFNPRRYGSEEEKAVYDQVFRHWFASQDREKLYSYGDQHGFLRGYQGGTGRR